MPVVNAEIASQLDKVADLLDIEGANPFRVRAYRRAARSDRRTAAQRRRHAGHGRGPGRTAGHRQGPRRQDRGDRAGRASAAPGRAGAPVPPGITALLALPGLGPKRVHLLHEKLGIDTMDKLAAAAKAGKLRDVPGFGPGIEARLLRAIAEGAGQAQRTKLATAEQVVAPLLRHLRQAPAATQLDVAGSYRRRRETVGDLDIVAAADPSAAVMRRFAGYEDVAEVRRAGADPLHHPPARRNAGGPAGGAAGELRRRAVLFHRLEGAQHRAAADRVGSWAETQRIRVVQAQPSPCRRQRGRTVSAAWAGVHSAGVA